MPTYDYKCTACGHTFDELQSFSEPPLTKCPACKKKKLERLFGGGGASVFKGSGFYETDYRRAGTNGTDKNGKADGDAAKPETKTETKADAAPAADTPAPAKEPAATGKGGKKGESKKTT